MKIRSRFVIRLLATMLAVTARLYFRLVRIEVREAVPQTSPYVHKGDQVCLYALWHHSILCALFCGRCAHLAGLVSRHADGSFVADAMECIGLTPIRGSNRRGGAVAMKQMIDATARLDIAIATDGPRGPHEVVKEGIIFLASQTGRPIIPTGISASRAWRPWLKWTYLLIPKPFSRAVLLGGKPFYVPPDLSREEREVYRQRLQAEMDRLLKQAEAIASGEPLPTDAASPLARAA
jgi:lysophospholipid acyltransferase (LPLAT)-like uncharacterized protein